MSQKTVNKREIIEALAIQNNTTITLSEKMIEGFMDKIKQAVKNGDSILLAGFGIFRSKVRLARRCRNPRTGEEVMVDDIKIVKFSPASAFKNLVK